MQVVCCGQVSLHLKWMEHVIQYVKNSMTLSIEGWEGVGRDFE